MGVGNCARSAGMGASVSIRARHQTSGPLRSHWGLGAQSTHEAWAPTFSHTPTLPLSDTHPASPQHRPLEGGTFAFGPRSSIARMQS